MLMTKPDSGAKTESVFTPMTKTQMASIRGGDDMPDWLVDLIEQFGDILDYLADYIVDNDMPPDFDNWYDDVWEELEQNLLDEGWVPLTEEELSLDW
jgi:hypothetical protein